MSDPAKNSEIEDVLSSIRRLVSEEARPPLRPQAPVKPDRLVLTPALRVADSPIEPPLDLTATDTESLPEDAAQPDAEMPDAEMHDGETHDVQADLPDHSDVDTQDATAQDQQDQDQQDQDQAEASDIEQDLEASDIEQDLQEESDPWSEHAPALETVLNGDTDDQDRQSETVATADEPAAAEPQQPETEGSFDFDALRDAPLQGFDPEQGHHEPAAQVETAAPVAAVSSALMDRIARMEAVVADQDGDWEPDGDAADANAATPTETLAWEDHVEDEIAAPEQVEADPETAHFRHAEPAYAAPDDAMTAAQDADNDYSDAQDDDFTSAEDAILDEEALREMVADIVRQELQGALGERITRNVRKLVRREIHRALASHELD